MPIVQITDSTNPIIDVIIPAVAIALLYCFALFVAGIIEITFGVFFYVFLALINCATNAKEERRDEDAIY